MAGLLLGLALAEGLARVRAPDGVGFMLLDARSEGMDAVLEPDPERLWRTRPGAVARNQGLEFDAALRFNSLGLRGPELGPRDPQALRVLALGDSFTLAAQVEAPESYVARLGLSLSAKLDRPVEVLNAGVDGYGTQQATRSARQLLGPTQSDALVLFFFLGNDFWENDRFEARAAEARAGGVKEKKAPPGFAPLRALARFSSLAAWLEVSRVAWTGAVTDAQRARYREELSAYTDPAVLEAWAPATRAALGELGELCVQRRLRCAVVAIPPAFVVHDERAAATFELFGLDPDAVDPARPLDALRASAPATLPILDATPALQRAAAQGEALYFTYDGHLRPAGHAVLAAAAAEALAQVWAR